MSTTTQVKTGLYIYAFMNTDGLPTSIPSDLVGIDDSPIEVLTEGQLAVAVSFIESRKIRPQRKNLSAHQKIVTWLAGQCDMLPVAFGLIADDVQQVKRLVANHGQVLATEVARVAGHMEMTVLMRWTVPNVVQYFVERNADLLAIRNALAQGTASREEQIAAGQLLESLVNADREFHTRRFTEVIRSVCKEIDVQPTKEDRDVMRLACLIPREGEPQFSQAIYQAASLFSDEFEISFNGPWPPYSFVNLALSLE